MRQADTETDAEVLFHYTFSQGLMNVCHAMYQKTEAFASLQDIVLTWATVSALPSMNLAIVHVQTYLKKIIMQDVLLKNKANHVTNKANHVIEQKYQPSNTLDLKISKSHNTSNSYEVRVKVQYIH